MIKRELYMSRIRPFIGSELIKVMTGIRRCGKSVILLTKVDGAERVRRTMPQLRKYARELVAAHRGTENAYPEGI